MVTRSGVVCSVWKRAFSRWPGKQFSNNNDLLSIDLCLNYIHQSPVRLKRINSVCRKLLGIKRDFWYIKIKEYLKYVM